LGCCGGGGGGGGWGWGWGGECFGGDGGVIWEGGGFERVLWGWSGLDLVFVTRDVYSESYEGRYAGPLSYKLQT